jgi:hypothetical protein
LRTPNDRNWEMGTVSANVSIFSERTQLYGFLALRSDDGFQPDAGAAGKNKFPRSPASTG